MCHQHMTVIKENGQKMESGFILSVHLKHDVLFFYETTILNHCFYFSLFQYFSWYPIVIYNIIREWQGIKRYWKLSDFQYGGKASCLLLGRKKNTSFCTCFSILNRISSSSSWYLLPYFLLSLFWVDFISVIVIKNQEREIGLPFLLRISSLAVKWLGFQNMCNVSLSLMQFWVQRLQLPISHQIFSSDEKILLKY